VESELCRVWTSKAHKTKWLGQHPPQHSGDVVHRHHYRIGQCLPLHSSGTNWWRLTNQRRTTLVWHPWCYCSSYNTVQCLTMYYRSLNKILDWFGLYYKCCEVWISNSNSLIIFKSIHFDTCFRTPNFCIQVCPTKFTFVKILLG
jgi:hypothetical protein